MVKTRKKKSDTKSPAGKSVVIIGCNSFLGKNVLKALETDPRYERVIAIDCNKPGVTLKKTKYYKLDLTATMADVTLAEILKQENCDMLIHTANPISPLRNEALAHEIIAIGTFYIFNACASAHVRKIVMASTTDVYGAFPENPNFLTEDMPPRGYLQNKFLADKVDAEKQALKYQKKHPTSVVSILRHATILGPNIENFKTRYFRRKVIMTMLGFDPLMQFVHEDDVLAAFLKLVHEDHTGTFNIGADGVLPLSRVINVAGSVNLPLTQIGFKTLVQLMWYGDISPAPASFADFLRYLCVVDNTKIKRELGLKFKYSTKEALLSFIGAERLRQMELHPEEVADA
jgi:UDP-glucose 4-epimerase